MEIRAETQCRKLEAETDEEPRKNSAYLFVLYGLFSLLSLAIQDYLFKSGTTTLDWDLPYLSLIKKVYYRCSKCQSNGGSFSNDVH